MESVKLPDILYCKDDLVIVGGLSLYLQGYKSDFRDIDIVCTNVDDIPGATVYRAVTGYTTTGMKAYSKYYEKDLDIFIEPELPEYILINGLKVQTLRYNLDYHTRIYPNVYNQEELLQKIKQLEDIIQNNEQL